MSLAFQVIVIILYYNSMVDEVFSEESNSKSLSFYIKVNMKKALHVVNKRFLSVALDTSILRKKSEWEKFNISSPPLLSMCKALSPAFFRFGGTSADYLIYNDEMTGNEHMIGKRDITLLQNHPIFRNITMKGKDWLKLNKFAIKVGWQLLFDLNALLRRNNSWDSDNAKTLLRFNEKHKFYVDWELGNELNAHHQITGQQLGNDFINLRNILNSFPSTNSSLLVGPDVTSHKFKNFLNMFLQKAKSVINAVTFHQYYFNGRNATVEDFLNVDYFDGLKTLIKHIYKIVNSNAPGMKIWLGETGSAYGGGAPNLSNSYIAGFLWLDKLGLSAVSGIDVVIRQSLFNGYYGLLTKTLQPLPDYWLSVIYKWLVGEKTLPTKVFPPDRKLRAYAHCTKQGYLYKTSGPITVFIINLHNSTIKIHLCNMSKSVIHQYLLTPSGKKGLLSRKVSLNGQVLKLNNTDLPKFMPKVKPCGFPVSLPPFTFGFYVLPNVKAPVCQKA